VLIHSAPSWPTARSQRILILGDQGADQQKRVSVSLKKRFSVPSAHEKPELRADFAILLGDNFYGSLLDKEGVASATDDKWTTRFTNHYKGLNDSEGRPLRFYPVPGNHDHAGTISALLARTKVFPGGQWQMPHLNYRFRSGRIAFIAVDTYKNPGCLEALPSLIESVKTVNEWAAVDGEPSPDWIVVYGHHPIFSGGPKHGEKTGETEAFRNRIMPDFPNNVIYLAGHEHLAEVGEYVWPATFKDRVAQYPLGAERRHYAVATIGNSGKRKRQPEFYKEVHLYCAGSYGFGILEPQGDTLKLLLYSVSPQSESTLRVTCSFTKSSDLVRPIQVSCEQNSSPKQKMCESHE